MRNFEKKSFKIDGTNYDSWKDKMKTYLQCMGLGYWLITKIANTMIKEEKLENCTKEERKIFMCDMGAKEIIFLSLP